MTRRGIRAGITMVVTGLVALVIGVLSAHYTGSLGPHEAEYTVRLNDEIRIRSEEHTSELQSRGHLVCRLLLEKKKRKTEHHAHRLVSEDARRETTNRP